MPMRDLVFASGLLASVAVICIVLIFMNRRLQRKQELKKQKEPELTLTKTPVKPEPRTSRGYPHVIGTGYTPSASSRRPRVPTRGSSATPSMSKNQRDALRRHGTTTSTSRTVRDDDVAYGAGTMVADTYVNTGPSHQHSTPSVDHSSSSSSSYSQSSSSCHSSYSHHDTSSSSVCDSGSSCSGGGCDW